MIVLYSSKIDKKTLLDIKQGWMIYNMFYNSSNNIIILYKQIYSK